MIPQRMRDISRTQLCGDQVREFSECSKREGFAMVWRCREEKDCMVECQKEWFDKPEFVAAVTEEYLNERSHYRQTGVKQKRYNRVSRGVATGECYAVSTVAGIFYSPGYGG